jgi:hypothetical protein
MEFFIFSKQKSSFVSCREIDGSAKSNLLKMMVKGMIGQP